MTDRRASSELLATAIDRRKVAVFQEKMLEWYTVSARLFPWRNATASQYQLIISEFLLQRTRAETVERFYGRFFEKYPSWQELANSQESEIGELIRPIGLWKRRTRTLKLLAMAMVERQGECPRTKEEIETLPGVGQYIANAILLLCYEEALPLLDSNMARVLERVFGPRKLADIRYDPYLQSLAQQVVQCPKPKELNWAVLDLASTVCLIRVPRMERCPVRSICFFAQSTRAAGDKVIRHELWNR